MIELKLLGRTQYYTSKKIAEMNAALFIKNNIMNIHSDGNEIKTFKENFFNEFQREDYAACINSWNNFAATHFNGVLLYQAKLVYLNIVQKFPSTEFDKPFI